MRTTPPRPRATRGGERDERHRASNTPFLVLSNPVLRVRWSIASASDAFAPFFCLFSSFFSLCLSTSFCRAGFVSSPLYFRSYVMVGVGAGRGVCRMLDLFLYGFVYSGVHEYRIGHREGPGHLVKDTPARSAVDCKTSGRLVDLSPVPACRIAWGYLARMGSPSGRRFWPSPSPASSARTGALGTLRATFPAWGSPRDVEEAPVS